MRDIVDGQAVEIQGSARLPYVLKNIGGVYSCSCPSWRNQSEAIERRTCKHLRQYRGEAAEAARLGTPPPVLANAAGQRKSTAPPLLLAETWDGEQDVTGWLYSEKLDGVRAAWTGKQFLSRQGNVYYAPIWFIQDLPPFPLDGELWLDRKAFQRTVSIVRRHDANELWREIRYVVFDAPALAKPFESRLKHCHRHFDKRPSPYVSVLPHFECRGADHLRIELEQIELLGGEGLMLRKPDALYEAGRSTTLLKVKRFLEAEARVIDYEPGKGRHKGRLGAVIVAFGDGVRFAVGSGFTDAQREHPPAIGSVVTFKYQELSDRGVPRFPTFVRVRSDVSAA